jgi:hypothetical protein
MGWIVLAVAFLAWRQFGPGIPGEVGHGAEAIAGMFASGQSGEMVEFAGRVQRLLADDEIDPPHQRFILELDNGHTVLIAHNLNLASRVPLKLWDSVRVRGEYEWNAQGGVVHWTHRDPGAGIQHGWIEFKGQRYE